MENLCAMFQEKHLDQPEEHDGTLEDQDLKGVVCKALLENKDRNAFAVVHMTVRPKKSKSIDVRFDWIQDRVRQKQIKVEWIAGGKNLGDFFTKSLPVHVHQELAHYYASPPSTAPAA